MKSIKGLIISKFSEIQINKIMCLLSFRYYNKFKKYRSKKKIIYTLVPVHGNMGDQGIAYATIKYLKENFSEYEIIEVYRENIYKYLMALKMITNRDDIVILHGGGNMGDLYPKEERDRRFIIEKFNKNRIISMTQTISFSHSLEGEEELRKTKKIYNAHKNLTLIAREKKSYEIMNRELDVKNIILNPDIVFYISDMYKFDKSKRDMIMTCLRSDKESILGNKKENFINTLNANYEQVFNYDTVIDHIVTKEKREEELKNMFNKFLRSKVVITDRLHGMVFCVVTKTPCIVTKSLDHKVTGTYEWIKELNYIKLVDNLEFENIKPLIDELTNLDELTNINFKQSYFKNLRSKICI